MKTSSTNPSLLRTHQKNTYSKKLLQRFLQVALAGAFVSQAAFAQICTPPTGSVGSAQTVCTGFSPAIYSGAISSPGRYRIAASLVSGNVTGYTNFQVGVPANTDIEPAILYTNSGGIIRYSLTPYGFGVNGIDDGGTGDDCISFQNTVIVDVPVNTCQPSCIGTRTFSNYRNATPAAGATTANLINSDGSNQLTITNTNTGSFSSDFPLWLVDATSVRLSRSGGNCTTRFNFTNATSEFSYTVSGIESTGSVGSLNYVEQVRVTGKNAAGTTLNPQFYDLQEGAFILNGNTIRDINGSFQASASFYFNEPVKEIVVEQLGSKDDIFITMNGCTFPADFGDLTVGVWPVASAVVPGVITDNKPDTYNASTRPAVVVWAGDKVSTEPATIGNGSSSASSDTEDDGLTPPIMPITSGVLSNFLVQLNANQPNTKVYYRMWFDWNSNGSFADDLNGNGQHATYAGSGTVTTSPAIVSVGVNPPFGAMADYKVRLVVSNDTIADVYSSSASYILNLNNGEVEDYQTLAILPVRLLQFTAQKQGTGALLNWKVADEINVEKYEIEYSATGVDFKTVSAVTATGGPSYSFVHNINGRNAGAGYYRLKSVDKDGHVNYSPVRSLSWSGNVTITLTPNPVKNRMQLRIDNFNDEKQLLARVSDATGRIVANRAITNAVTDFDVTSWANGIYQVQIIDNSKVVSTQKIVKY